MKKNKNNKNGLIWLIIVFIFFLLIFASFYYYQYKLEKHLKILTEETVGTVIKYETYSKSGGAGRYKQTRHYHNMTINYEVDGKKYSVEKDYIGGNKKIFKAWEKIDVLYNPNNPEDVVPETLVNWRMKQIKSSRIATTVMTILTTGFFTLIFYNNNKKIRKGQ